MAAWPMAATAVSKDATAFAGHHLPKERLLHEDAAANEFPFI